MTIRFYLVRHAEAERTGPGGDAARRLTAEGRARFAAHARALARALQVARIVTSPYARAAETAAVLGAATGAKVSTDGALASGASSGRAILLLGRAHGAGAALVGHNPELAEAVARAAGRDLPVAPGTIVAVDDDGREFTVAWVRAIGQPGPT
jgi:phosphohistidine phosphatase